MPRHRMEVDCVTAEDPIRLRHFDELATNVPHTINWTEETACNQPYQ